MPCRTDHHDEGQGSLVQRADHHICISFVRSKSRLSTTARTLCIPRSMMPTLYPAAYPRPGNNDVNFRATVALEYSLNMTLFNLEADVI